MATKNILNIVNDRTQILVSSVEQLGSDLQKHMLSLKGQFLADDGRGVDYPRLRISTEYQEYCKIADKLNYVELKGHSEEERKSFFINVYNSLTIHGLTSLDILPSSVLEIQGFWTNTCYNIGGLVYSLDDIEHGVLRCNRPHPSGNVMFNGDDPRLVFTMTTLDPRIHFALVCGAKSCPAIQIYSSAKLDRSLTIAAKSFCQQEVSVDSNGKVSLSKIFQWYYKDFGDTNIELLKWISDYLLDDQKLLVNDLIVNNNNISLGYKEYNWLLNKF